MMVLTTYDRIRAWRRQLNLTSPKDQFLVTIEELGELDAARRKQDRDAEIDAIGDVTVTLVVLYDILTTQPLEAAKATASASLPEALGLLAEGLRKPKKSQQAKDGCVAAFEHLQRSARESGISIEEGLEVVVPIIEGRLAGIRVEGGTAIKDSDQ